VVNHPNASALVDDVQVYEAAHAPVPFNRVKDEVCIQHGISKTRLAKCTRRRGAYRIKSARKENSACQNTRTAIVLIVFTRLSIHNHGKQGARVTGTSASTTAGIDDEPPPGRNLHELALVEDLQALSALHDALSAAEWEEALCRRDSNGLTPLGLAVDAEKVRSVSCLLSLGAASSLFVQGPGQSNVWGSRELAVREDLKALVDSALAQHIKKLGAGGREPEASSRPGHAGTTPAVDQGNSATLDSSSVLACGCGDSACTEAVTAVPGSPGSPGALPSLGDLVRLKPGLRHSSVLVSERNTDNGAASEACLGSAVLGRLGVVVRAGAGDEAGPLWVASLASGHVCQYLGSDLVFADGSSPHALAKAGNETRGVPLEAAALQVGDTVKFRAVSPGCCVVGADNFSPGATVVRGPDWISGDQDGGVGGTGVLTGKDASGQAVVRWHADSREYSYRLVHNHSSPHLPLSKGDLKYADDSCVCGSSTSGEEAPWKPESEEVLVVCSVFHEASARGIIVSNLKGSRLWLARAPELEPVRLTSVSHVFKTRDLVRLDSAVDGASAQKCLGAPADLRHGIVIGTGSLRGGIQRNIEVALIGEEGEEGEAEHIVSIYSALDLVPMPRVAVRSTRLAAGAERRELIAALERLSRQTRIPLNAHLLVDKFGISVWSRLWALFASHDAYTTAFQAFCAWHTARMADMSASVPLPPATEQLLTLRELYQNSSTAPVEYAIAETAPGAGTWACQECHTLNMGDRRKCIVCAASMPTWECAKCLQVNFLEQARCQHCHHPTLLEGTAPADAHTKRVRATGALEIQSTISSFAGFKTSRLKARMQAEGLRVRFLDTALPEEVEAVWLLNDSRNKKERVSAVLENVAGLTSREADTVMMQVLVLITMLLGLLPYLHNIIIHTTTIPASPPARLTRT
jgi:hypothetical protein